MQELKARNSSYIRHRVSTATLFFCFYLHFAAYVGQQILGQFRSRIVQLLLGFTLRAASSRSFGHIRLLSHFWRFLLVDQLRNFRIL